MIRRNLMWFLAAAGLVLLAMASAPAFPAEQAPPAQGSPPAKTPATAEPEKPAGPPGTQAVEAILRQQEEVLSGQRFSYDPAGRRDPFRSLYDELAVRRKGPRPKGVAGMLVSEVELSGIVSDATGGDVALFMGSDGKGYFLRIGDEVYDGTLMAMDRKAGTVTFRQQVDDPRLIKPYRDVVKRLVPQEEEKANE